VTLRQKAYRAPANRLVQKGAFSVILQARSLVVHLSAFALTLGGLAGCSSSPSADAGAGASADVSFSKEVVPILQNSCAVGGAACHGDPSVVTAGAAGNRDYLGPPTGPYSAAVITQILGAMVGKPSLEDPSMNVVTAGDPTKSFLMYKIDFNLPGDPELSSLTCTTGELGNCGTVMPYPGLPDTNLSQAMRDTIRSWITQGAQNN
jgi:hypothetical protein